MTAPTTENYGTLQLAYDEANAVLFAGELPHCMIILLKKSPRNYGHYAPMRYQGVAEDNKEAILDEIAINPAIVRLDKMEVLQTLVHEMCHLWQQHFGQSSRNGYHNKEWGAKMDSVGLPPSKTGEPGGKRTGQQMADYVQPGGPFEKWATEFFQKYTIRWGSSDHSLRGTALAGMIAEGLAGSPGGEQAPAEEPPKPKSKIKYSCACSNAWGKPGLNLGCKNCGEDLKAAE
jgi:hypothetical protein